jgi:hypothetical protein
MRRHRDPMHNQSRDDLHKSVGSEGASRYHIEMRFLRTASPSHVLMVAAVRDGLSEALVTGFSVA